VSPSTGAVGRCASARRTDGIGPGLLPLELRCYSLSGDALCRWGVVQPGELAFHLKACKGCASVAASTLRQGYIDGCCIRE
jgi:hypothetical protein